MERTPEYFPVNIAVFPMDSMLDFDLYLKNTEGNFILYRSRELPFSAETRDRLLYYKVEYLHLKSEDRKKYQRFLENNLDQFVSDPALNPEQKADIIYQASANMMEDILGNPEADDNLNRTAGVAQTTVEHMLNGRDSFFNILSRSVRDYQVYTHSIHVCNYALAIAQAMGYREKAILTDLATGALLHDIGKSVVPDEILHKKGVLSKAEMEIMKKHPADGLETARKIPSIPTLAHIPIIQHHEKVDGSGYPYGLTKKEMHIFGRITAVADVFDAITSNRSYAPAKSFFDALKYMMSERDTHLDTELLMKFVSILGNK